MPGSNPFSAPVDERGDYRKLAELIGDVRVAMLLTFGGRPGPARGRPMYTQKVDPEKFDGDLWFMTDSRSDKLEEVAHDPRVCITYADAHKNKYCVVYGTATAERDPAKAQELWNVHAKGWWPDGPASANLVLLRVRVERAEYWDGPSNTAYLIHLVKAVVTGTQVKTGGVHGTVGH